MKAGAPRRGPTARDLSRLALARASSRLRIARAREAFDDASLAAFRAELGATVRQVSPFLLAMLEGTGISVADVARAITPARGWPKRPRLPAYTRFPDVEPPTRRGLDAAGADERWTYDFSRASLPGALFLVPSGMHLHVHVVDHSIEAAGRVGPVWFVSLFGMLSVRVPEGMGSPAALVAGRTLEEGLELPGYLRKGWTIERVAPRDDIWAVKLLVRTGVCRCRLARGWAA